MTFTEDWFCEDSCNALADLAGDVADVPGRIIEIGSWEGRSTIALANAAHPREVHAVDWWRGSPGEISADLASTRDVYARFKSNIDKMTAGNVQPHRMDWRRYAHETTGPVALLFIDAEHTYHEVHATIEAFKPHMQPGSVMCGDDAYHPPIRRAVLDAFPAADAWRIATLWVVNL